MIGLTHLSPVYAGGALIATQVRSTTSDNVVFHTADPVTGTTMLMGDNGTYTYKEESEPLGQRIEPVDPSPGYPSEYSEITDIASQPEWNCTLLKDLPGGFFNMPVECQKKEAQMMYFTIEGALQSMEPGNPQRIAADHEAGHKGHGKGTPPTLKPSENLTPEEVAQRRELAATGIFDNEGDDAPDDPSLDPPEDTWDFLRWELSVILPLLRDKVKFVGFTKDQEQILASNLLRTVASKKCVDAFRKAGLSTPAEVMRDRGLIFGTFESLLDPSNNQVYGITEDERRYIRATKNDVLKMAFTADPDEKPGPVITWFHDWAFTGTADTTYSFEETFTHERIHASGVPPTPYYFLGIFKIGHDLDGYEHYGNIIENCSNEGGTE